MSFAEWVFVAAGASTTLTAVALGFRWIVRGFLMELKPNHGSSLRDAVTRLEESHSRLEQRLDQLMQHLITNR